MGVESSLITLVSFLKKIKDSLDKGIASSSAEASLEIDKTSAKRLIEALLNLVKTGKQKKWLEDAFVAIRNNNSGRLGKLIRSFDETFRK